jgi:hypothetical protein
MTTQEALFLCVLGLLVIIFTIVPGFMMVGKRYRWLLFAATGSVGIRLMIAGICYLF